MGRATIQPLTLYVTEESEIQISHTSVANRLARRHPQLTGSLGCASPEARAREHFQLRGSVSVDFRPLHQNPTLWGQ